MHTTFTVTKDARGEWRWVAISSTAFRDRDRQIVSTKALASDVARADADRDYGPLLYWHMPGVRLGDCDFNALHGRCLIESGTFRDEATAKAVAAQADAQALSIGFEYPAAHLDADGVFHTIRRRERSILPHGVASNLFTRFGVKGPTMTIDAIKAAALRTLLGEELAASILTEAAATEKAADAQGVAYKEAKPLVIDGVTYFPQAPAAPPEPVATKAEGDAPPASGDISADMRALADYIIAGVAKVLATQEASEAEGAATEKAAAATKAQQIEAQIATLQQQQTAALAQQQQTDTALKAAQASLAELTQAQPRALSGGYRPSRDEETVVKGGDPPAPPPSDFDRAADFILAH